MKLRVLIGRNVRRLRVEADLTQEELAFRADMDRTYLSDIERGLGNPTIEMLGAIATVLQVPLVMLLVPEERADAVSTALQAP